MTRACQVCGKDYPVNWLSYDNGFCPAHQPGFLDWPIPYCRTPAHTEVIWRSVRRIHLFFFVFFLILGGLFDPLALGAVYGLVVLLYFAVRFTIARIKGYPILTRFQSLALELLPLWGLAVFVTLFYLAWHIRTGGS
jgi:hypothetical protein